MSPAVGWTETDYHRARGLCRQAWERSQPQLVIDGWAGVLDEQDTGAVLLVEPARSPSFERAGSNPHNDGHGANLGRVARRAQKGA